MSIDTKPSNRLPKRSGTEGNGRRFRRKKTWPKRLRYRYREGVGYLYDWIRPLQSGPVRLVIFSQGRTGTTLLENLLCSTGYFSKRGELLNPSRGEILFPIRYVRGLAKRAAHRNFIFHLQIYHLTRDRRRPIDPASFLNTLHEDGWKIIFLRRRNKIKHALSTLVAKHRGGYQKFDDEKETFKIFVDCEKFVERVKGISRLSKAEERALRRVEYREIFYEEHLERADSHQKTVDEILKYVSLEPRKATTKHKKINTQPLADLISNYGEFDECLVSQEWQEFLER